MGAFMAMAQGIILLFILIAALVGTLFIYLGGKLAKLTSPKFKFWNVLWIVIISGLLSGILAGVVAWIFGEVVISGIVTLSYLLSTIFAFLFMGYLIKKQFGATGKQTLITLSISLVLAVIISISYAMKDPNPVIDFGGIDFGGAEVQILDVE
jgi:hypothetical protein